jgi:hypothetical protein
MVDISAPIIPWEGMGGIKLYSTIRELRELLEFKDDVNATVYHNMWVKYEVADAMELFFHLANGKLFKITTLEKYQGKLFGEIGVGTLESDLQILEPSFVYEDFEEVFESEKGAFIATDPMSKKTTWISVFIKEMNDEDFDKANW